MRIHRNNIGLTHFAPVLGAIALSLILSAILPAQGGPSRPGGNPAAPRTSATLPSAAATPDEIQWLVYMRQEEKLARDFYQFIYERWKARVFERILSSEERHFSAVGLLLARYAVPDPVTTDQPGIFTDAKLASLYKELTAKGALSLKDALEVGVLIEKTDIEDLEKALLVAEKTDIKRVFTNLLNGSYNHLDAFETNLELLCMAP